MAERQFRLSTKHLECPVCMDIFRDPRFLPCAHTICIVRAVSDKKLPYEDTPDKSANFFVVIAWPNTFKFLIGPKNCNASKAAILDFSKWPPPKIYFSISQLISELQWRSWCPNIHFLSQEIEWNCLKCVVTKNDATILNFSKWPPSKTLLRYLGLQ